MVRPALPQEPELDHPGTAVDSQAASIQRLIWHQLRSVKDPEIPVLDVVEMGVVRAVEVALSAPPEPPAEAATWQATVTITPTFSACPALHEIERGVRETTEGLLGSLIGQDQNASVAVITALSPPWSSDDMTAAAREKLESFGIAPAPPHGGLLLPALEAPVRCPRCGYPDTRVRNAFGSTLCREIRSCNSCQETFERFKPL